MHGGEGKDCHTVRCTEIIVKGGFVVAEVCLKMLWINRLTIMKALCTLRSGHAAEAHCNAEHYSVLVVESDSGGR